MSLRVAKTTPALLHGSAVCNWTMMGQDEFQLREGFMEEVVFALDPEGQERL
jgi:hypothetical protein